MKNDVKQATNFDETIKKMADEIIKAVNVQGNIKDSSNKKKK